MNDQRVEEAVAALGARYGLDQGQQSTLAHLVSRVSADREAPTAVREPLAVVDTHIADSLSGLEIGAVRTARRIADIGAGAGFPGIVLACALPGSQVSLVESQSRKCRYMSGLLGAIGIVNAAPVCSRAEEWRDGLGGHDLVVARAVGPQPLILEYGAPLLELGGTLVDWRGGRERDDEQAAARAALELGLELREVVRVVPFAGAERRHLHVFSKLAPTPARFPRRAGAARKRPLGTRAGER